MHFAFFGIPWMRGSQYEMWKYENILEKKIDRGEARSGKSVSKVLRKIYLFAFMNVFFQQIHFFVFQENRNLFSFFSKKYLTNHDLFLFRLKTEKFQREKNPTYPTTLNFVEKPRF